MKKNYIFNKFLKTFGAGPKPKRKQKIYEAYWTLESHFTGCFFGEKNFKISCLKIYLPKVIFFFFFNIFFFFLNYFQFKNLFYRQTKKNLLPPTFPSLRLLKTNPFAYSPVLTLPASPPDSKTESNKMSKSFGLQNIFSLLPFFLVYSMFFFIV